MRKALLFTIASLFSQFAIAQQFCNPLFGGVEASDEPPGCLICTETYNGSTFGFTADTFAQNAPCGEIENSQWLSVQADYLGRLNLRIEVENCANQFGIQIALYDQDLEFYQCSTTKTARTITANGLIAGGIYWLMIDGVQGDICDFTIERNVPLGNNTVTTTNANRAQVCLGAEVCFKSTLGFSASQYVWEVDTSGVTILSGGGYLDSTLCVRFEELGKKTIKLNPIYFCNSTHAFVREFSVENKPVYRRSWRREKCQSDLPFTEYGQIIENPGFNYLVYRTVGGCDSVYEAMVERILIEENESKKICEGDTLFVDGRPLTEAGTYEFLHEFASEQRQCDSLYRLQLSIIDTSAQEITCFADPIVQGLGIKWAVNPDVTSYRLQVNDSIFDLNNRSGFLYQPEIDSQLVQISLQPFSATCFHHLSKVECSTIPETTGTETIVHQQIDIIPNPSFGVFKIQSKEQISLVEIFDFSGTKIFKTTSSEIDLSEQSSGVFFFKIKTPNSSFIKKVVKI